MDVKIGGDEGIGWKLRAAGRSAREGVNRLVVLFKLRVVVLLVLSSIGGALLASGGKVAWEWMILLIVTGVLASAGASAINQYLERDRDGLMVRTRRRPLAVGSYAYPELILALSVGLVALAVLLALPFSLPLAFFLAAGAVIYVGVYTVWLKPRTLLNIVIGGAAGSCAVLSGGAAGGNWAEPGVLALALLVFAWTPTHFWSLAQAYRDDYARAGVPMLPVVLNPRASAGWILIHTLAITLIALLMGAHPLLGGWYLLITIPAVLGLGWHSLRLIVKPDGRQALKLFKSSNIFLGMVLMAIYLVLLI